MASVLNIQDLVVNYGAIEALSGISLSVDQGEIITLIGANGAGKSTTMNSIMSLVRPKSGSIQLFGQEIVGMDTRNIGKRGCIMAPECRQIFPDLSVLDNLLLGGYFYKDAENHETLKTVYDLFPVLEERKNQMGLTLSGGEQQMLAIGRAMMAKPKILLLDEPSLGLAPLFVSSIFKMVQQIREMGVTILLVEQNARMALKISDRAYVLETGKIVHSGTGAEMLGSEVVMSAYLGG